GAADLCAAGVGAPHIRQRLWWVADSTVFRRHGRGQAATASVQGQCTKREGQYQEPQHDGELSGRPERLCGIGRLADTAGGQCQQREGTQRNLLQRSADNSTNGGMEYSTSDRRNTGRAESERGSTTSGCSESNFWTNSIWIPCKDGKTRRISSEPAFFPLVDG